MKTSQLPHLLGFLVLGLIGASVSACRPEYPNCDSDKDCKQKEFCVNNKCQQCRDNGDCGEGKACTAGKCTPIAGYCSDHSQCPSGQACIGNRCRPCGSDTECGGGLKCIRGSCIKAQCTRDDQCAQDQECQNGICVSAKPKGPTPPPCGLEPVYFDFDKSTLTPEATNVLNTNVTCLKKAERQVNLVGRADPRGTPEYNMALSDRRAQAVKEYVQRLGIQSGRLVPVPRGELDASGTEESGWAKDRRVDSEWQ
jgi:peptidoglycan-associated lipoprotein